MGGLLSLIVLQKMKLQFFLSVMLLANASAGWRVHFIPERKTGDYYSPERVSMSYYADDSGYQKFSDALKYLKSLGKIDQLDFIRPWSLTESAVFQKELITGFKELAPKEWAAAERSSGNMHNPKMHPLWKHLTATFMTTTLAKSISRDLEQFDLVVSEFGQEKLRYEEEGEQRKIKGIFHVSIASKPAEQDGARQPATAPESKPEGNKKTKPEAEGRSQ